MEFKASLDIPAKIITLGITVLFASLIIWPVFTISDNGVPSLIYVPAALLIIYFGAFIYSPRKYSVTENTIIIHRPIGNVTIPQSEITALEISKRGMPFAMRTFGVGGLFGYFGSFYNFDMGNMSWYITRRDKTILIKTSKDKKILISPDDRDAFVAALQK
ncbi:MAG TPA: PH domain-containing protein [Flavobacterium sp.]|nr:PH domain-containing protein [Flavobacterium sp.]